MHEIEKARARKNDREVYVVGADDLVCRLSLNLRKSDSLVTVCDGLGWLTRNAGKGDAEFAKVLRNDSCRPENRFFSAVSQLPGVINGYLIKLRVEGFKSQQKVLHLLKTDTVPLGLNPYSAVTHFAPIVNMKGYFLTSYHKPRYAGREKLFTASTFGHSPSPGICAFMDANSRVPIRLIENLEQSRLKRFPQLPPTHIRLILMLMSLRNFPRCKCRLFPLSDQKRRLSTASVLVAYKSDSCFESNMTTIEQYLSSFKLRSA